MSFIRRFQDYSNPNGLARRMRQRRGQHVLAAIQKIHAQKGSVRILDAGGRVDYWSLFDRDVLAAYGVQITVVNLEPPVACDDPMFVQQPGDACGLEFPDNSFDLVHSNSVIEHVGDWAQMQRFAAEVRRLAPCYYVQCPNFWFPVEPHFSSLFFHWWPEQMRARAVMRRPMGFCPQAPDLDTAMACVQHARLLDRAQMQTLFPDAEMVAERFAGLVKSWMAIRG